MLASAGQTMAGISDSARRAGILDAVTITPVALLIAGDAGIRRV
jgi:hypothetical protein